MLLNYTNILEKNTDTSVDTGYSPLSARNPNDVDRAARDADKGGDVVDDDAEQAE